MDREEKRKIVRRVAEGYWFVGDEWTQSVIAEQCVKYGVRKIDAQAILRAEELRRLEVERRRKESGGGLFHASWDDS
jgi:hypothetical protein